MTHIKNTDLRHFGQWVLFIAIFAKKNGLSENIIFDWMLFLEQTFKDNSNH